MSPFVAEISRPNLSPVFDQLSLTRMSGGDVEKTESLGIRSKKHPVEVTVKEAAEIISRTAVVTFTGTGISKASGSPGHVAKKKDNKQTFFGVSIWCS